MNDMIICCVNTHVDGNDHDDVPCCVIQFINVDLFCLMATYFETKLIFLQRLEKRKGRHNIPIWRITLWSLMLLFRYHDSLE